MGVAHGIETPFVKVYREEIPCVSWIVGEAQEIDRVATAGLKQPLSHFVVEHLVHFVVTQDKPCCRHVDLDVQNVRADIVTL